MDIKEAVSLALERGWKVSVEGIDNKSPVAENIRAAVRQIINDGSAPNRQMLLTIAAGAAVDSEADPKSLQLGNGQDSSYGHPVDRRGQQKFPREVLTDFRDSMGFTLKISKDPGVSNQWREPEINGAWVAKRRGKSREWAASFLHITDWLASLEGEKRQSAGIQLLDCVCEELLYFAMGHQLNYPRFQCTPRLAIRLTKQFIETSPDRPDATESVVAAAIRVISGYLYSQPEVMRNDVNSPDPIDVQIVSPRAGVHSGVEVTDERISLSKIQHEVVPAMLKLGLDHAVVVSRGLKVGEEERISEFIGSAYAKFEQRIDLVTVDVIESWLTFPGAPKQLATEFLWAVGVELDNFARDDTRRAWLSVLDAYTKSNEQL